MKGFCFQVLGRWAAMLGTVCLLLPGVGQSLPELRIERLQQQQVSISWRQAEGAFLPEWSDSLSISGSWRRLGGTPVLSGDQFRVVVAPSDSIRFVRLRSVPLATVEETSPAAGESGVAITRESVWRFSQPLAEGTLVGPDVFFAEFGGRRILSRAELSSDRQSLTLFHLENLPGGARVRVTFRGDGVRDLFGREMDADGDGLPGGIRTVDFETLGLTPVPGTAVVGRVFASELMPGRSGGPSMNVPLAGVTITVDGLEETVRTTTDALGNFRLSPVPAGRFFVHVDGRTAAGSQWPDGAYYPFVGKVWEAVAGRQDNLAAGTGEIFLPRVMEGTLKPVSATDSTVVTFPLAVVRRNPDLAGVSITVPPNGLVHESGARGGKVGIAPVPPDRLPEPLPPGLNLPLVITVQTDGPANFDRPVPVRFPNRPDRETGKALPPGGRSALWSFNHDTGNWEISGGMTVTEDGAFVESDPGMGLLRPGWNGTLPGTQGDGGNASSGPCDDTGCSLGPVSVSSGPKGERFFSVPADHSKGVVNWFTPGAAPQGGAGDTFRAVFCSAGTHEVRAVLLSNCGEQRCEKVVTVTIAESEVPPKDPCTLLKPLVLISQPPFIAGANPQSAVGFEDPSPNPIGGTICYELEGADQISTQCAPGGTIVVGVWCKPGTYHLRRTLTLECGAQCSVDDGTVTILPPSPLPTCQIQIRKRSLFTFVDSVETFEADTFGRVGHVEWHVPGAIPETDPFTFDNEFQTFMPQEGEHSVTATFTDCTTGQKCTAQLFFDVFVPAPGAPAPIPAPIPLSVAAELSSSLGKATEKGGERVTQSVSVLSPPGPLPVAERPRVRPAAESEPSSGGTLRGLLYYALVNLENNRVLRGVAGRDGVLHPAGIRLAPRSPYREFILDAATLHVGSAEFTSGDSGQRFEMPTVHVKNSEDDDDVDGDGLSSLGEFVMGTDANRPDSDGDGVPDGAEVKSGDDPVNGLAVRTGVLASAETPAPAVDVDVEGNLAAVSCQGFGVVLFNVLGGMAPVRIAQVETPGEAVRVAIDGKTAVVADGPAGITVVDLADPPAAKIRNQVNLGSPVRSVAAGGGVAYAGLQRGGVVGLDLESGQVTSRLEVNAPVLDLALAGDSLHVLAIDALHRTLPSRGGGVPLVTVPFSEDIQPRRLFVAGTLAYVIHADGVAVYDFGRPGDPAPILVSHLTQRWDHLALNGSGLGLAGLHVPSRENPTGQGQGTALFDVSNPALPPVFLDSAPFPGIARAVVIHDGLGYVAAEAGGLQVVNYLARDTGRQAPTIALSATFPLNPAVVEEGKLVRITATVTDDAQVRNVTFFLDGMPVATDGSFPFEHRFSTPPASATRSFTMRALASDTAGNERLSDSILVAVTPDVTAPGIGGLNPADGGSAVTARALAVFFDEPIDPASLKPEMFTLLEAGPDQSLLTADDIRVTGATMEFRLEALAAVVQFPADLPPGLYRGRLEAGAKDLAGNAVTAARSWTFTLTGLPRKGLMRLAAGQGHTLAIEADGRLWAWGDNSSGQMGDGGSREPGRRPVRVGAAADWVTVAATRRTSAALRSDGSLWTWGDGRRGVLGQGAGIDSVAEPTRVGSDNDWMAVWGGEEQFYAVRADGSLWAWGRNQGSFGNGSTADAAVPVRIGTDLDWSVVSPGDDESGTLAVKRDGSIWFWDGNESSRTEAPTQVGTDTDWVAAAVSQADVVAGTSGAVALKSDGTLWRLEFRPSGLGWVRLGSDSDWERVSAGSMHLVAMKFDGTLWTLGRNDQAELGDGTLNSESEVPVRVALPLRVVAMATRFSHSVARTEGGEYFSWGANGAGQLGRGVRGTAQAEPRPVSPGSRWVSADFGQAYAAGLKVDGTLWTWGRNLNGELGDGSTIGRFIPGQVGGESNWVQVATGGSHVLALKRDGTAWAWGLNSSGQLAVDPAVTNGLTIPTQVGSDRDWRMVAAGFDHSLGIKMDGSLWAWGGNDQGQLGDGTTDMRPFPVRVGTDTDWQWVAVGGLLGRSTFALKADGSLWAWGENGIDLQPASTDYLGVGDPLGRRVPTPIGGEGNWRFVAAGGNSKRLVRTDGTLWTWRGVSGGGAAFQKVDFVTRSFQVFETDLTDPRRLASRLVQQVDPVSTFLWGLMDPDVGNFPPEARQALSDPNIAQEEVVRILAGVLNLAAGGPSIHTPERFASVTLSAATQELLAQNPATGELLAELNRRLLDDALGGDLSHLDQRTWVSAAAGMGHVLGVRQDGSLWGGGDDSFGQLGSGSVNPLDSSFRMVNPVRTWSVVSAGRLVSAGIRDDGGLWTWGDYAEGLLGDPSLLAPRPIGNAATWSAEP